MINELVSIIVPIYNVEEYLNCCIESIINQTYNNLEIILVNDGSTDSCAILVDEWGKKDNRIKVIHKSNEGVSKARNIGVLESSGEFIVFVDPDDFLDRNFVNDMISIIKRENSDLVICNYRKVNKRADIIDEIYCFSKNNNRDSYIKNVLLGNGFLWNKIFKRSLIVSNSLKFNQELIVLEDELFILNYLKYCKKASYTDKILYNYRIHNNSVLNSQNKTVKKIVSDARGRVLIYEFIKDYCDDETSLRIAWNYMILSLLCIKKEQILKKRKIDKNDIQVLSSKYRKYSKEKIRKTKWRWKDYAIYFIPSKQWK